MLDFNYLLALIIVKTNDTFEQMNPGVIFLFCALLFLKLIVFGFVWCSFAPAFKIN
jgi:hypothetical protein